MDILGEQPGEMRVSSRVLLAASRRGREYSWQVVWALKEQGFLHKGRRVCNELQNLNYVEASSTPCGASAPSRHQEGV